MKIERGTRDSLGENNGIHVFGSDKHKLCNTFEWDIYHGLQLASVAYRYIMPWKYSDQHNTREAHM